jgi:hypothetical protein
VIAGELLEWHPEGARSPLVVNVRELFNEALGREKSGR